MGDLARLIEAVEAGAFLMDVRALDGLEVTAYKAFGGSLDAAKALHDALLSDYGYGVGGWGARVWLYSDLPHWDGLKRQEVELPHAPARAWLLAILRALEAEGRG